MLDSTSGRAARQMGVTLGCPGCGGYGGRDDRVRLDVCCEAAVLYNVNLYIRKSLL